MMRSLNAAVSGMRNHQTRMDVIGNNIANVNTLGFKAGRVSFQEALTQNLRSASRPSGLHGGSNPLQIGLGMEVSSIDTVFTQGTLESTGRATDLALQGDGLFVLGSGAAKQYTRVGNFGFDANGALVSLATGLRVQGTMADAAGNVPPVGVLSDIMVPSGLTSPARATTQAEIQGNLDSRAAVGATVDLQLTVFDSLGNQEVVSITFTKTGVNTWDWSATDPSGGAAGAGSATFNPDGSIQNFDDGAGNPAVISYTPTTGANPISITVDGGAAGTFDNLTQYAEPDTAFARAIDGSTYGSLEDISIDGSGFVYGSFTNGEIRTLARLAVAQFTNYEGLNRVGEGLYEASPNSGQPTIKYAGDDGSVAITSGTLEMSNVELTQEFTSLITTQRGFQANARVISVSDEMLAEVANLKR